MSRMGMGMLVVAGMIALNVGASAADLAVQPVLKAPPRPAPVFSWTGFYIGGHLGGGWGTSEGTLTNVTIDRQCPVVATGTIVALDIRCIPGSRTISGLGIPLWQTQTNGFLGGGQAGYNLQLSNWAVIGVEGDIAWTDIKGTSPCIILLACSTKHDWLATATGRFGVTYDRLMFYAKGGAAWADTTNTISLNLGGPGFALSVHDTRFGWVFGTGVEYAFLPNWSAKLEYNYMDFGNKHENFVISGPGGSLTFGTDIHERLHVLKGGINYRFATGAY